MIGGSPRNLLEETHGLLHLVTVRAEAEKRRHDVMMSGVEHLARTRKTKSFSLPRYNQNGDTKSPIFSLQA